MFARSESIKEVSAAIVEAQVKIKAAPKTKENPYFNSRYADLAGCMDVIREPLHTAGLSVCQFPGTDAGKVHVETVILHKSGEWISCKVECQPKDQGPQSVGSAITYLRRYGLSIIGLVTDDDDDGNAAHAEPRQQANIPPKQKPVKKPEPQKAQGAPAPQEPAKQATKEPPKFITDEHHEILCEAIAMRDIDVNKFLEYAGALDTRSIADDQFEPLMLLLQKKPTKAKG